jgi:protein phosphatase 2C
MEIIKSVRPMESLEMDSRFVHRFIRRRRRRDIKEMMCKSGVGELKSGPSLSESPNSGGIQGAGGVGGGDEEARSFVCSSHRSISVIGRRRTMEDEVRVAPGVVMVRESEPYDFFAVYDGHGGAEVANKCRERLHLLVAEEVGGWGRTGGRWGLEGWEKVMSASFARMDEEVDGCDGAEAVESVGSTAVVVLVGREEVVVANCGDSRAVMCHGGVAVPLSLDHKVEKLRRSFIISTF